MELLFIIPYAPTRIRTRPHNFIKYLAQRAHHITLATLVSDETEEEALAEISGWGVRVIAEPLPRGRIMRNLMQAALTGLPFQARYSWSPKLAAQVRAVRPDVVHVEHLRGALYGTNLKEVADPRLPVVWDSVDSISHLFAQAAEKSASRFGQLASRLELNRTRRYEGRMVQQFDRVVVTSAQDRHALEALAQAGAAAPEITVIPNGVDADLFHPIDEPVQPDTIIFTGKMSYHANVTAILGFVRDVMPQVWERRPAVRLIVVGKDPDRQVRALAADRRIEVIGAVPEMRPYLGRAAVAVAPIAYGAGIQNKVLEAMACRTPVVASPQAVAALSAEPGREVLVGGDAYIFANEVLQLLENGAAREAVAAAGFQFVSKHHRWEEAALRLEELYYGAIQSVG